jgi:hypothetical protein
LAGGGAMQYGDIFSYTNTPRALIFARNQSGIRTLDDMKRIMRYNNFKVRETKGKVRRGEEGRRTKARWRLRNSSTVAML